MMADVPDHLTLKYRRPVAKSLRQSLIATIGLTIAANWTIEVFHILNYLSSSGLLNLLVWIQSLTTQDLG